MTTEKLAGEMKNPLKSPDNDRGWKKNFNISECMTK